MPTTKEYNIAGAIDISDARTKRAFEKVGERLARETRRMGQERARAEAHVEQQMRRRALRGG